MSELKKEEILSILETAFSHLLKDINYKETRARYEQAKEQIKTLIQKPVVDEDIVNRYKVLFHDAPPSMIEQLIRKLIKEYQGKKPGVTEEWIEKKAKRVWNLWWYKAAGKYATDFTGTIRLDFQGVKNLIRSLKEDDK